MRWCGTLRWALVPFAATAATASPPSASIATADDAAVSAETGGEGDEREGDEGVERSGCVAAECGVAVEEPTRTASRSVVGRAPQDDSTSTDCPLLSCAVAIATVAGSEATSEVAKSCVRFTVSSTTRSTTRVGFDVADDTTFGAEDVAEAVLLGAVT